LDRSNTCLNFDDNIFRRVFILKKSIVLTNLSGSVGSSIYFSHLSRNIFRRVWLYSNLAYIPIIFLSNAFFHFGNLNKETSTKKKVLPVVSKTSLSIQIYVIKFKGPINNFDFFVKPFFFLCDLVLYRTFSRTDQFSEQKTFKNWWQNVQQSIG
jgi:hypothetical protein